MEKTVRDSGAEVSPFVMLERSDSISSKGDSIGHYAPSRMTREASMKQYYVYILTNKYNSVLYIGITSNLVKRVYEHKNKLVKGFTLQYNVDKLVYFEIYQDPENAIKREKAMKNLLRSKKFDLIKEGNAEFKDLYVEILSG